MLDSYMRSGEYEEMITASVDNTEKYKAVEKEFVVALDKIGLDSNTYDSIECPVVAMTYTARDLGYKKGFYTGMKFVLNALSSGEVIEI